MKGGNNMKKFITILAFVFFGVMAMAQTSTIPVGGVAVKAAGNIATTTNYTYRVQGDFVNPYYVGWQIDIDSVSGTAAGLGAVFNLKGSHDGTTFFDIDTLTYAGIEGSSHDTTAYKNNTTAMYWRFLRASYTVTDTIQVAHTIVVKSIKN